MHMCIYTYITGSLFLLLGVSLCVCMFYVRHVLVSVSFVWFVVFIL